jgi:integrase
VPRHPAAGHRDRRAARPPARLPARPGRAAVHHPRRERAQPRELAAADLAALVRSAPGIPPGTTFHRLRHAYASLLGDAALPDHDIQLRLGHAHPGEVRWYRHPYPGPGDCQATRGRHRHCPHSRNRPWAGSSVLTLLTEKLTSLEPGHRAAYTFSQVTGQDG